MFHELMTRDTSWGIIIPLIRIRPWHCVKQLAVVDLSLVTAGEIRFPDGETRTL